jgi:hypothetical protein
MDPRKKKRRRQLIFLAALIVIMISCGLMTGILNVFKGLLLLLIPLGLILLGM